MKHYGGIYLDCDSTVYASFKHLHLIFDFYAANQHSMNTLGPGLFGAKPQHPIVNTWLQLVEEFHGISDKEEFGVSEILPCPMECWDYMWTLGPRLFTAAVYISNSQPGNNDIIFRQSILLKKSEDILKEIHTFKLESEYEVKLEKLLLEKESEYQEVHL